MESIAWVNMISIIARTNVYDTKKLVSFCTKHREECSTYHGAGANQLRNTLASLWLHAGNLFICSYLKQHADIT